MHDDDRFLNEVLLTSPDPGHGTPGDFALSQEGEPLGLEGPGFDLAGEADPYVLGNESDPLSLLGEGEVDQAAAEFMGLSSEAEMEEFLGGLFKKVGRAARSLGRRVIPAVGKFVAGPGRQLLARALPLVGSAVGSALAPGAGTAIGGALGGALGSAIGGGAPGAGTDAGAALAGGGDMMSLLGGGGGANPLVALLNGGAGNLLGSLLGGEAEHGTHEEAKLDLARRVVSTVAQAAGTAATDATAARDPQSAVRRAFTAATQRNLPLPIRQVLAASSTTTTLPRPATVRSSGTWHRSGSTIVLRGV